MVSVSSINKDFQKLMAKRSSAMLQLADHISGASSISQVLTRPLLGKLMSQAVQLEELLDAYGARNNRRWYNFRLLMATTKLFSDVSYELLHIQHALPAYRLLDIEEDFVESTNHAVEFTGNTLMFACRNILREAAALNLPKPSNKSAEKTYAENLPPGRLRRDLEVRSIETVSETVTLLATSFLNLAEDSDLLHIAGHADIEKCQSRMPDCISEETLRLIELRFHNLQSLYDTHVSETEVEELDPDLPVLRGHISVVFHLLRTATAFSHYYERHVKGTAIQSSLGIKSLVNPQELLSMLIKYSINYSSLYLSSAQHLCHEMLKRHAEIGEIEVAVPKYRGFHVRPSTLVSKIVQHYGSNVQIKLQDECCNAALPLDIFRINEKINAEKRRGLTNEIAELDIFRKASANQDAKTLIYEVISTLEQDKKIVIYERPLQLPENLEIVEGPALKYVTDEIARLQAMGKIDIETDIKVKLCGDTRVLADIKILAESGYGEDNFGNNTEIPKELVYLRR